MTYINIMRKLLVLLSLFTVFFVSACTNPANYTLVDKDNIAYEDVYIDKFSSSYTNKYLRVVSESDKTKTDGKGIIGTWYYEYSTPNSSTWYVDIYTFSANGKYRNYFRNNVSEIVRTGTFSLEKQSNGLCSYWVTIGDEDNKDVKLNKYMIQNNTLYF